MVSTVVATISSSTNPKDTKSLADIFKFFIKNSLQFLACGSEFGQYPTHYYNNYITKKRICQYLNKFYSQKIAFIFMQYGYRIVIKLHLIQQLENMSYLCAVYEFEHTVYNMKNRVEKRNPTAVLNIIPFFLLRARILA